MPPIPSSSSYLEEVDAPSNELIFCINEKLHRITEPNPRITTLDYLREHGYTGTKLGCGEGGCGACTVVIATPDGDNSTRHLTANACLLPLCTLHGKQIITVEGIGCPSKPHAVQERLALGHGSQCGFCTPGIVMSMYGLLQMNKEPTIHDIEDSFEGNLCRCTGYRPILDSFKTFASDSETSKCQEECTVEEQCNIVYSQQTTTNPCSARQLKTISPCAIQDLAARAPYDPDADVSFPRELRRLQTVAKPLAFASEGCRWFRPTRLQHLLSLKTQYPQAKLVGGNSEIGVEMRLKSMDYRYFIDTSNVKELLGIEWDDSSMTIGVNITLTEFIDSLKSRMPLVQKHQRPTLQAFLSNLKWFAGRQIRNFATVGGNIATGSPISDLNPIFIATRTVLTLMSQAGPRQVKMSEFFQGYRQMDCGREEVVISANVPLTCPGQFVRAYKQARRKDDDIAIVNASFWVQLDLAASPPTIQTIEMAYGGMGATTLRLTAAPKAAVGLSWGNDRNLDKITTAILDELCLPYTVIGGMPSYRRTLAASFFKRFWHQTSRDIGMEPCHNLDEIERQSSRATQAFGPSANHNPKEDPLISQSLPHLSALPQTTGVARYVDDIPKVHGELYAYGVLSTQAHAEIVSVDDQEALNVAGVVKFISHADVPGHNEWGILIHDEEFFATKEVHCVGQLIGLILAETKEKAKLAAQLVKVTYKPLPFLLSIDDAIRANSFYPFERKLSRGTITEELFSGDGVVDISGECQVGGQEHFYLETQGCLIVPKGENGELEVFTSSQNLAESQHEISRVLNIPSNRIVVKTKRLGGGFGGKETRATTLTVAAAVGVHVTGRPVRWVLDRDVDMLMTGNRHPFYYKYRLAITRDGYFKALDLQLVANAGCTYDLSRAVLERAVTHCDNVYYFPAMRVIGKLAKTNMPSNTAFRGFGGPQGMMGTEMIIARVANQLGLDPAKLRQQNFYKHGQLTHFKMPILDWHIPEMWDTILKSSDYSKKLKEINKFNASNLWRKRGIAAIPTKFAISFGQRFMNQAGATVLIYTDGSVLLSHGGVEIGQGLHTKMVQLCANALKVPLHNVYIAETSTDKVPNTSPTAASTGSDLNGMAVLDACRQLNERLQPYRDQSPPDATLGYVASLAYMDMVSLSAHGFYKAPVTRFDWEGTGDGNLFLYFTTGVAVAQVEVDVLTGDHVVVGADLIMDVGNSINFAIDLGQIEGAFVQGMGWCTTEENLVASSSGRVITLGPGNYKVPGFRDVPQEFNVTILAGKTYSHLPTVKSSKGIGEPPLFLGTSVYFALHHAITAARKDNNAPPLFPFPSPATPEIIRMACGDPIAQAAQVAPANPTDRTWSIRP